MKSESVIINSLKYDGNIRRGWNAVLIRREDPLLIFVGEFDRDIKHVHLGLIRRGTISYEYYWLDRWYSVFRFHEPDGKFRNFYCNINMPPSFDDGVLSYVDLDIDLVVSQDFAVEILDLGEFESNSAAFGYPTELRKLVFDNLVNLQEMVKVREFPFDFNVYDGSQK